MGISVRDAGTWKPNIPYVRSGGSWSIPRGYVRQSGVWVPAYALQPLSRTLTDLKLSSGLYVALDAGDSASYSSGQVWSDTSGGGIDFNRGSGSGSDAADPTFNGSPGGLSSSEYWSFDGADYFTKATGNDTTIQNMHKAGCVWSVAFWAHVTPTGSTWRAFGTAGPAGSGTGVAVACITSAAVQIRNAGAAAANFATGLNWNSGAWNFFSASIDAANNTCIARMNDTTASDVLSLTSPASGNASQTLQIGAGGNAQNPLLSGFRMGEFGLWGTRALTADEMTALFQATRDRYGV